MIPPKILTFRKVSGIRLRIFAFTLLLISLATAQVDTAWVSFLNGGPGCTDEAYYMCRNDAGQFLVTGTSNADIFTACFSPEGDSLWAFRFDGGNMDDRPHGLVVDDSGFVYVSGWGAPPAQAPWYFVLKYRPDTGDTVWTMRIPGMWCESNGKTTPMMTYGSQGCVYVTGSRKDSSVIPYATSFCTMKINHRGQVLWTARYPTSSTDYFRPAAIARDAQENLYVVGTAPTGSINFATVKYDSAGQQQWVAIYDGPAHNTDYPYAVVADNNGHVYVAGRAFTGGAVYTAFCTICYDAATGDTLWVRLYAAPDSMNEAYLLTLDGNGNILVAGTAYSMSGTGKDIAVVQYDPSGNLLWEARYENFGDDAPEALSVDDLGNVYLTGNLSNRTDILTVKFDSGGNLQWSAQFRSTGWQEVGHALNVETENILYVAGRSRDDFCLLKYAPAAQVGVSPTGFDMYVGTSGTASATFTITNTATPGCKTLKWKLVDRQTSISTRHLDSGTQRDSLPFRVFELPFPAGTEEVNGLTWGNLGIWIADVTNQKIIKLDPVTGQVLRTFPTASTFPGGLAHDGYYLWFFDFAGDQIRKIHPLSGDILCSIPNPLPNGEGLTCDGTDLYRGGSDSLIIRFDTTGTVTDTIPVPAGWCQGLGWDGSHLWYAITYQLWQLAGDSVVQSMITPGNSDGGITFDGQYLRFADNTRKQIISADVGIPTADCPWLTVNDTSGTLEPGQSTTITLEVNAAGLNSGRYRAHLLLTSNDPDRHTLLIPVQLNVNIPNDLTADSPPVPLKFRLKQNFPNPFNPVTTIAFSIPGSPGSTGNFDLVTLQIFDILGRQVETLIHRKLPPGEYQIQWDASHRSIPSGIYYYQLTYGNRKLVKKMVLIK